MQLRDKIFDAGREKTADFNAVVDLFRQAFPQEVLDSGDLGEAKLINVLSAIKALKAFIDKWNMGNQELFVFRTKEVYKELTNMTYATSYSPEFEAKMNDFAEDVNDLRLLNEKPIPSGDEVSLEDTGPVQS